MLCFNVDLEIRFNFELGNTERTLVECEKFVNVDKVIFKEALEDQVEGCDDEQFEIRPGQESGAHQVLF